MLCAREALVSCIELTGPRFGMVSIVYCIGNGLNPAAECGQHGRHVVTSPAAPAGQTKLRNRQPLAPTARLHEPAAPGQDSVVGRRCDPANFRDRAELGTIPTVSDSGQAPE